jgi:polyhydroxybutyrate depolymerase
MVIILLAVLGIATLGMTSLAGRVLRLRASLREVSSGDRKHFILVDGVARNYLLHVPGDLLSGKPAPLVLVFHGGGGHDWNMPGFTHFDDLADQESFLERWHSIDAHRVYATGISNGGFFSNRLACDLADKIAAIASVAATMPKLLVADCKPSRAVSVLYMQGTEDPLVPINGGPIGFVGGRKRGENISLADSAKFWCDTDRISSGPQVKDLPDRFDDGTHVRREIWTGGKDDTEVNVYTIEGGGHTWPGGPQYLPKIVVGRTSQNLNATRTIWEFFQGQELP